MRTSSLNTINQLLNIDDKKTNKANKSNGLFDDALQSAMNLINETNTLQKKADNISLDFAMGNMDNVHDVMIAQEKASIALQYTVEIRNKVIDAYNEIMRMQI